MARAYDRATIVADVPGEYWAAITPNDSTELNPRPRALWIGGAGHVGLTGYNDVDATVSGVAAGTLIPVSPKKVKATSTTATLIIGIY